MNLQLSFVNLPHPPKFFSPPWGFTCTQCTPWLRLCADVYQKLLAQAPGFLVDISFVAVSLVGGQIDGKSTCEDFCQSSSSFTSVSGPVLNPFDKTRSAGGSSSGSAVLVGHLSTFVVCTLLSTAHRGRFRYAEALND